MGSLGRRELQRILQDMFVLDHSKEGSRKQGLVLDWVLSRSRAVHRSGVSASSVQDAEE